MDKFRRLLPYLMLSGALAALLYVYHVVAGGLLWKDYSHLMQPISDLTASGAPDRDFLLHITNAYGFFATVFALLFLIFYANEFNKLVVWGAVCLLILEIISLSYGFFPEDMPDAIPTFSGKMHIVVTALIVPFTIVSPLIIGLGMRKLDLWRRFAYYSIATSVLIVIFGSATAYFYTHELPYFGLIERFNIGTLQLWLTLFSIKIYRVA